MGSFDSTCVITRLPVHEGDPVLFVRLKKDIGTYELLQEIGQRKRWEKQLAQIKAMTEPLKQLSEVYASLKDKSPEEIQQFYDFRLFDLQSSLDEDEFHSATPIWGTYNDYGWIEELKHDYDQEANLFIHRRVAEQIAAHRDTPIDDPAKVWNAIVEFAFWARIPLSPITLVGEQYATLKELEQHEFALNLTREMLEAIKSDKEY